MTVAGSGRSGWFASAASVLLFATTCALAQEDLGYDPGADPFAQLAEAQEQAKIHDRYILAIAGGDWCIWCHWLHAFLEANPDVNSALEDTFVVMKVYYGDQGTNDAFFATLPEAIGYPHFWILSAERELLFSQKTVELEDGDKSYNKANFMAFIDRWKERR